LKKIYKKFCTFAFSGENDFNPYKHPNQAIYGMSLGSLYYIWGVGGSQSDASPKSRRDPSSERSEPLRERSERHNM